MIVYLFMIAVVPVSVALIARCAKKKVGILTTSVTRNRMVVANSITNVVVLHTAFIISTFRVQSF